MGFSYLSALRTCTRPSPPAESVYSDRDAAAAAAAPTKASATVSFCGSPEPPSNKTNSQEIYCRYRVLQKQRLLCSLSTDPDRKNVETTFGDIFFRWPGNKEMGPCTGTSFISLSSNKSHVLFRFLFTYALNARPYDATTSCCTSFRAKEEGNGRNVFTVRSLLRGTKGDVPPTFYTAFFQEGRGALLLIASERISMEIQGGGGEGRGEKRMRR